MAGAMRGPKWRSTLTNERNIQVSIGDIVRARKRTGRTGMFLVTNVSKNGRYFKGMWVVERLPKTVKPKNAIALPNGTYALLADAHIDIDVEDVIELSVSLGFKVGMQGERAFKGGCHWKSASGAAKANAPSSGALCCTALNKCNIRVSIGDLALICDRESKIRRARTGSAAPPPAAADQ